MHKKTLIYCPLKKLFSKLKKPENFFFISKRRKNKENAVLGKKGQKQCIVRSYSLNVSVRGFLLSYEESFEKVKGKMLVKKKVFLQLLGLRKR